MAQLLVRTDPRDARPTDDSDVGAARVPVARIGILAGVTGMQCCVGPTVLAALGLISAGTAYTWAEHLYGGYAWWFRLSGVALAVLLLRRARRRGPCTVPTRRRPARSWLTVLLIGMGTYAVLYAATTVVGDLAR